MPARRQLHGRWLVILVLAARPAGAAILLDDPLNGSTIGTRSGGTFIAGGWRVDNQYDSIYWHVPNSTKGAFEYDVRGIGVPCSGGLGDKNEISHMYDYTFGNADVNYSGGYRDAPYKHFIRKQCYVPKVNTLEILWVIAPNFLEDDSAPLSWDANVTYRFRCEWENTGTHGILRTYRNGALIHTQTLPGAWDPGGLSVRIAASPRRADEGAHVGAVYSNVKVYDLTTPDFTTEISIDLGSPDVSSGLSHPQIGDGDTTPFSIGGRTGRRNVNPAEDFYFYFAANDGFVFQGNNADLYILADYYDAGTAVLTFQYDAIGADFAFFYKNGGSVTLTNTNTWKTALWHVTDAYFGNRQNGGADFRIGSVGNTFYLDVIKVTTEAPVPPLIAEVAPDPEPVLFGAAYSRQLTTLQGDEPLTWTLLAGPPGSQVSSNGLVSGWTPSSFGDVTFNVEAANVAGADAESWIVRVTSRFDFDTDGDVDLTDFAHLQACFSGDGQTSLSGCEDADGDGDGDVDGTDFAAMLPCLLGASQAPGC